MNGMWPLSSTGNDKQHGEGNLGFIMNWAVGGPQYTIMWEGGGDYSLFPAYLFYCPWQNSLTRLISWPEIWIILGSQGYKYKALWAGIKEMLLTILLGIFDCLTITLPLIGLRPGVMIHFHL